MADNNALILIGMRGENGARAIQIDVSEILTLFPTASRSRYTTTIRAKRSTS